MLSSSSSYYKTGKKSSKSMVSGCLENLWVFGCLSERRIPQNRKILYSRKSINIHSWLGHRFPIKGQVVKDLPLQQCRRYPLLLESLWEIMLKPMNKNTPIMENLFSNFGEYKFLIYIRFRYPT